MNTTHPKTHTASLTVTLRLARLLERLENSTVPIGPDQYRSVVQHLSQELSELRSDNALGALLDAHAGTAELYENLNYQHAGLCRSPLDFALAAELRAKEVIEQAKRFPKEGSANGKR